MKQICESCGRVIEKPAVAFHLKIEMFADPAPPEFTEDDLNRDFAAEMERLVEELESADPQEAEDEVYEAYMFTLCAVCRKALHQRLKELGRGFPFEERPTD
jgi:hypothetical protein